LSSTTGAGKAISISCGGKLAWFWEEELDESSSAILFSSFAGSGAWTTIGSLCSIRKQKSEMPPMPAVRRAADEPTTREAFGFGLGRTSSAMHKVQDTDQIDRRLALMVAR
jgi:hypothetical protein